MYSTQSQIGQSIPVKGVRKAIAQNMVTSVTEIPHGWMMLEVDATNLVKLEIIIKIRSKRTKVIINFLCILCKSCC